MCHNHCPSFCLLLRLLFLESFTGQESNNDVFVIFLVSIPNSVIIRISAPIKKYWSESKGLDMDKLMSDGAYKEKYRTEMIIWGEEKRAQDSGFFCRTAIEMFNGFKLKRGF